MRRCPGETNFLGDTSFEGKMRKKWYSCIDSLTCSTAKSFEDNEFQYYTNGNLSSAKGISGTYSNQLYPYFESYTYHHGNVTLLVSDTAKMHMDTYGVDSLLYPLPRTMLTAMTFAQMAISKRVISKVLLKVTDTLAKFVPQLKMTGVEKPMKKYVDGASALVSYADLNFYGWLHLGEAGSSWCGTGSVTKCVYSKLPSGRTAVIHANVDTSVTDLSQVFPNRGVLRVAKELDASWHVDVDETKYNLAELWGVDKDPAVIGLSDRSTPNQSRQVHGRPVVPLT